VDFDGDYYRTLKATVYDRPDEPVPIYIAASGPLAAKLAGRAGDGFIVTSGKKPELYTELTNAMAEGAHNAGRDPARVGRMIEIKVSYDRDRAYAHEACRWWAALALTGEEKAGIEDPVDMEAAADADATGHTRGSSCPMTPARWSSTSNRTWTSASPIWCSTSRVRTSVGRCARSPRTSFRFFGPPHNRPLHP
jgi:alkanesulfonate monooxygenase SsuD/methylene tetrahydromethanopterin reductase-like flavin-dependent oxidoreductase (luciferase family)